MARPVATSLRPLVEATGVRMPDRTNPSRGARAGLRHYDKSEYVDALLAYRDSVVRSAGGQRALAASAAQDGGFNHYDIVQFRTTMAINGAAVGAAI